MRTSHTFLFQTEGPWITIGTGEAERRDFIPPVFYSMPGQTGCVRLLRGWKMKTRQALMDEFAAAFQFFEGFGENWLALGDCLSYLDEWLPADGYVVVIERTEDLLGEEEDEQSVALLKTLDDAGKWWSQAITDNGRHNRPAIPFHALLHVTDGANNGLERIEELAQKAGVAVRRE